MEHLQKIIFLISLFLPVMLSFALGLWYAWARWFKDSTAFNQAIDEHHALVDDLDKLYKKEHRLAEQWEKSLIEDQKIITREVTKVVKDDEEAKTLHFEIKKLKAQVQQLDSHMREGAKELEALSEKNTALENKVSSKEKYIVTKENDYLTLKKSYDDLVEKTEKAKPKPNSFFALLNKNEDKEEKTETVTKEIKKQHSSADLKEPKTPKIDDFFSESTTTPTQDDVIENTTVSDDQDSKQQNNDHNKTSNGIESENIRRDEKLGIIFNERPDTVDDLKKIKGVAKVLEAKLHEIGIYRFEQIVRWTPEQIDLFSEKLAFPDRIKRDEWQKQAAEFQKEGEKLFV